MALSPQNALEEEASNHNIDKDRLAVWDVYLLLYRAQRLRQAGKDV